MPALKRESPFAPGAQIGMWRLVGRFRARGRWRWQAVCSGCSTESSVLEGTLLARSTQGCQRCGQARRPTPAGRKHGKHMTPEWIAWRNMKARCRGNPAYRDRGIRVAEAWLSDFEAFFAHIGPRPSGSGSNGRATFSVDRIDNDGDYAPGNVRWSTARQQAQNRRKAKPPRSSNLLPQRASLHRGVRLHHECWAQGVSNLCPAQDATSTYDSTEALVTDYQCSLTPDGLWHATQEQAAPPAITRGGAFSTCSTWLDFKRGFERRRPTCPECLRACEQDEQRRNRVEPVKVRRTRPVEAA